MSEFEKSREKLERMAAGEEAWCFLSREESSAIRSALDEITRLRRQVEQLEAKVIYYQGEKAAALRIVAQLEAEVARLRAALSAAMKVIRRPGMLIWGWDETQQLPGYWVRIENDWHFAGPGLTDAINMLAAVEEKD